MSRRDKHVEKPRLKQGEPIVSWPTNPKKLYFRCLYHTFFWGPYDSIEEVAAAMKRLTERDPYWDYDCVGTMRGDTAPERKRNCMEMPYISREEHNLLRTLRAR